MLGTCSPLNDAILTIRVQGTQRDATPFASCATLAVCVVLPVSTSAKRTPIGTGRTRALARLASECPRALVTLRTLALAGEPQDLRRDQEKPDCFRHGE